jgi:uncharacterized protein (DUF1697 family)
MGSFNASLLSALLSIGVPPDRAQAVVEQLDRAIDERYGLHAQVIATKRDVAELQAATHREIAALQVATQREIAAVNAALSDRIAETNERIAKLDGSLASRFGETNARIAETKAELTRWTLAALTAQTALLLGALKLL